MMAEIRICARPECGREIPPGRKLNALYCCRRCQRAMHSDHRRAIGLPRVNHQSDESRQAPLRPAWRLGWNPSVVILPLCPAPIRRYSNGVPTPFQDDLNAIADHGSPGMPRSPGVAQARQSALAGLI